MVASFRLEEWLVDPFRGNIVGPDGPVRLEPRVMRVLVCLAEKRGEIVSREQLIEQVWEGTFVTDEVLTQSVSELRKALGEGPKDPRFIQTIPKQGYRLIAPVVAEPISAGSDAPEANPFGTMESDRRARTRSPNRGGRILWAAGALLAVGGILAGGYLFRPTDARTPLRLALTLPPEVFSEGLALSPDGKWLAFIVADEEGNAIRVRELESGKTQGLAGTEGAVHLFWSPDSRFIGFGTLSALKKVELAGGSSETVREGEFEWGGTWSGDGTMVVSHVGEMYRVPASGGELIRLQFDDGGGGRVRPFFLPDGDRFLYFAAPPTGMGRIFAGSLSSGETRFLAESDSKAIYADGRLLFVRDGVLIAQRFDAGRLELQGEPRANGPQLLSPGVVSWGDTPFSVSQNGLLAFRSSSGAMGQLVWFDRQGRELGRIPQPTSGEYVNPAISPDGRTIAVNRRDPTTGNRDIWLVDAETGIASRLTSAPSPEVDPVWSPDGTRIAFAAERNGRWGAWIRSIAGGSEVLVWGAPGDDVFFALTDWSKDGRYLLGFRSYTEDREKESAVPDAARETRDVVWVMPLAGEPEPWPMILSSRGARDYGAHFSPDGRWIAYSSSETGLFEIHVATFPEGDNKKRISGRGGVHPLWGADGRELFYWGFDIGATFAGPVMRVQMNPGATGFRPSLPAPVFEPRIAGLLDGRNNFAVASGSERFLLRRPIPDPPAVTVIANWTAELAR